MEKISIYLILSLLTFTTTLYSQYLSVPTGTAGIGTSSNSFIGLGTSAPGARFHIYGSGAGLNNSLGSIMIGKNNGPEISAIQESADDDVQGLSFRVKSDPTNGNANFEAMRISHIGNLGVGTDSPGSKIDISLPGGSSGSYSGLRIRAGNNYSYYGNTQLLFSFNQTLNYSHAIKTRHDSGNTLGNSIDFFVWKPGDAVGAVGSHHVMSLNGGRVGIGVTSPSQPLDINTTGMQAIQLQHNNNKWVRLYSPSLQTDAYNNITTAGDAGIIFGYGNQNDVDFGFTIAPWSNAGTGGLRMNAAGSVGIGTPNPQSLLHILGENPEARVQATQSNKFAAMHIMNDLGAAGVTLASYGSAYVPAAAYERANGASVHTTSSAAGAAGLSIVAKNPTGYLTFHTGGPNEKMRIDANGNVGIGTNSPDQKLTVNGIIHTEEVRVDMTVPGPDYVFAPDYNLLPLSEVESYIKAYKHLPEVPSAKQMEEEGLNLKEMNLLLLKKVEELTLHLIEIKKENSTMKSENQVLKQQATAIDKLKADLEIIKEAMPDLFYK
jgi:hypothetical protein